MSTRATLKLIGDWHLYNELTDDGWHAWLEFPKVALEATESGFALRIPTAVWKELRDVAGPRERFLSMTREELRAKAVEWVRERQERMALGSAGFFGVLIADPDDPSEKQVDDYIREFTPPATSPTSGL